MRILTTALLLLAFMLKINAQTKVTAPLTPNSLTDTTYGTHIDTLGYGGTMVFKDIANRDNVPFALRKQGMLAIQDTIIYQLQGGIANANWQRVYLNNSPPDSGLYTMSLAADSSYVDFRKKDTIFRMSVGGASSDTSLWSLNGTDIYNKNSGIGNVGININLPTANLHVNGSVRLGTNLTDVGYVLTSIDDEGNAEWKDPALFTTLQSVVTAGNEAWQSFGIRSDVFDGTGYLVGFFDKADDSSGVFVSKVADGNPTPLSVYAKYGYDGIEFKISALTGKKFLYGSALTSNIYLPRDYNGNYANSDGDIYPGIKTISVNTLALNSDNTILCNATLDYTLFTNLTLPYPGKTITIKNKGAGTTTILPDSSSTIEGIGSYVLNTNNQYVTIQYDLVGHNWEVIGNN